MPEPTDPTESGDPAANPPAKKTAASATEKTSAAKKTTAKKTTAKKTTAKKTAETTAATEAAAASAPTKKTAAAKKTAPAGTSRSEKSEKSEKSAETEKTGAAKKTVAGSTAVKDKDKSKAKETKEKGKAGSGGAGGGRLSRLRRDRDDDPFADPTRTGPVLSVRTVLALVLFVGGIAWMAYYYIGVRTVDEFGVPGDPTGPALLGDLGQWNYAIGFGAILLGLVVAAHPSTPLGRGRGVVVGMLGCFLIGLLWICVFYVISGADYYADVPVFNDLEQKNLIVGIAFMAIGFTYATRWE